MKNFKEQEIEIRAEHINRFKDFRTELLQYVCSELGIDLADFVSDLQTRKREYVLARQIMMKTACDYGYTERESGAMYGGKDHSTANYAKKTIANLIDTDKNFRELMINIENKIKQLTNDTN